MRYLTIGRMVVTGGAGFIGSAMVWALNGRGVTKTWSSPISWAATRNGAIWCRCGSQSTSKPTIPPRLTRPICPDDKFSAVFHLGACSATTEKNAAYLADNNTRFTAELAAWALQEGARFVYASSAATYGDGAEGMSDTDDRIDRLRPLNMYGYSKHLFDLQAQRQGWLKQIVGVKYFNVFGPNEDHKGDMRSLVNKAYGQIQNTGQAKLFKSHRPDYRDGEQKRDFLYVKDAARMTVHLAERDGAAGLFNIGAGTARTWLDLAHALFAAMDRTPQIEFIEMPPLLQPKYQYSTCAAMARFRSTEYALPVTSLEAAVDDYVKNYLIPGRRLGDEPSA